MWVNVEVRWQGVEVVPTGGFYFLCEGESRLVCCLWGRRRRTLRLGVVSVKKGIELTRVR